MNKETSKSIILLGSARTGSNYLMNLLASHPDLNSTHQVLSMKFIKDDEFDELINEPINYIKKRLMLVNNKPTIIKLFYSNNPKKALANKNNYLKTKNKKQFYESLDKREKTELKRTLKYDNSKIYNSYKKIWIWFKLNKNIKIIHLSRSNILEKYVSLFRALKSDKWTQTNNDNDKTTIKIVPKDCLEFFKNYEMEKKKYTLFFSNHKTLNVDYNELYLKKEETCNRILEFIGVSKQTLSSNMKKQNNSPLFESIENYDEIKDYFKNTKWSVFFN
jgi:LPS sulfotransferase NodH